ncbi:fimbrial protein [Erwinia billingiae]|uniref:fimbrial protein n=1 Tax=Erwinia billingiae TaxID=182337 RepID=UPI00320B091C
MTDSMKEAISRGTLLMMLMCLLTGLPVPQATAVDYNNLQISGALVSEPCKLDAGNNTLSVAFGSVIAKSLYSDSRTKPVPFAVTLTDCDTSIAQAVNLTFSGIEDAALPGRLAASGEGGTGIGIGIETVEGVELPINQATPVFALQNGTTLINLQAWVQAEPDAIDHQSLIPGEFNAVATLDASYP